jgi:hypothetical protein
MTNLQASPAERIRAFEKRYSTEEAVRQAGSKFDVADYLRRAGALGWWLFKAHV